MGAFFTNIQLKIANNSVTDFRENVIEYLIKSNAEKGFIKVDNENVADKSVIISSSNDSLWLSIYDEEMEEQDSRKLNKLSSELSKRFNTTSLSVLVHDSDLMYVGLNVNGKLKDTLSNLSKGIDFTKRNPNAWSDVLLDNFSFEDIKDAWLRKRLFVEDFLIEFAKFTEIDKSKLLTGFEYLSEEKRNDGIKLNFASKDRKEPAKPGLTKFSMIAGAGLVNVKSGGKYTTDWMMTNQGTFSNGLDIVIAGECIDRGLLIPEIAKASYVAYKGENQNEFTASFLESISTTGKKIYFARFEDMYIPKGFQPTYPMTAKEGKRYSKIRYESAIQFKISFIGKRAGNGGLTIFFSPLVNRENGSYGWDRVTVQVTE